MSKQKQLALVAGAGAGLGQALLSRFEAEGFQAVGLGRTRPEATVGDFHTLDLADAAAVPATIAALIAEYGPPPPGSWSITRWNWLFRHSPAPRLKTTSAHGPPWFRLPFCWPNQLCSPWLMPAVVPLSYPALRHLCAAGQSFQPLPAQNSPCAA